jgi:hypothetical protein
MTQSPPSLRLPLLTRVLGALEKGARRRDNQTSRGSPKLAPIADIVLRAGREPKTSE